MQFIGGDDEIPMRERDELRRRNSFGDKGEIPMWNRDKYGNAMRIAFMVKFQCGKRSLLWKCNLVHRDDEIPTGNRPIFNSVEYSET